ncbi:MAG: hypothetical protein JSW00_09000 [Thermoplasmata archaeon]|nr:MAG: hypothetical protein JSW00_09000 [Thermoplasmata archaeon]
MSQVTMIKRELEAGGKVSQLSALRDYGCMRLSHVIWKLRQNGLNIETDWRNQRGKRYAVYRLVSPEDET